MLTPNRRLLLLLAIVILPLVPSSVSGLDTALRLDLGLATLLDTRNPAASPLDSHLAVGVQLFAFSDQLEVELELQADSSTGDQGLHGALLLDRIRVDWLPLNRLQINIGRFADNWSPAVALPALALFTPQALPEILPGAPAPANPWLIEAVWYLAQGYLKLQYAPEPPRFYIPDPDTPWFPQASVPEVLSLMMPANGRTFWYLNELLVTDDRPSATLGTPSAALAAGWSFMRLDLAAVLHYGWNPRLITVQETSLVFDAEREEQSFDMTVYPYYDRRLAAGLQASGSFRELWWWMELGGSPGEAFAIRMLASDTPVVRAPTAAGTAGIGWFLPRSIGTLLLESTWRHIFTDQAFIAPSLATASAAALEITPSLERLQPITLRLGGLIEYPEHGGAFTAEVLLDFHPQLTLSLSGAVFYGNEGSLLRSYRDNYPLQLGAILQF